MSTLDKTNFRETAQGAIEKYRDKGAIIDALLWGTIIGLYEDALRERDLLVTWMRNIPSPEDVELARLEIERSPDVIAAIRKLNEQGEDDA